MFFEVVFCPFPRHHPSGKRTFAARLDASLVNGAIDVKVDIPFTSELSLNELSEFFQTHFSKFIQEEFPRRMHLTLVPSFATIIKNGVELIAILLNGAPWPTNYCSKTTICLCKAFVPQSFIPFLIEF